MSEKVKTNRMPSAIPYIIGNEAAERFNYYGLRAILVTFMVTQFYNPSGSEDPQVVQMAEATANAKTHDFVAMSYLLPLFGGMVADWFWGKYKTILYLSIVYAIGNILLATFVDSEVIFTSALMLIALGAGGIKPCVSANVGDQFDESNQHLMSKAFSYFYASINAGSLLSILLIPYLKHEFGPRVAFGVPAIAMLIATAFFYAGRNRYVRVPPKGDSIREGSLLSPYGSMALSFLAIFIFSILLLPFFRNEYGQTVAIAVPAIAMIVAVTAFYYDIRHSNKAVILFSAFGSLVVSYLLMDKYYHMGTGPVLGVWIVLVLVCALLFKKQWFARPGNFIGINLYALTNGGFSAAAREYGDETIVGIRSVWRVFSVFAFVPFFWALWDQSQSEWVVQATKLDLNWLGITWQAEQISFVNAGFILAFIPFFNVILFPLVEKMGIKVTPLRKIGAGLVLTALSFVVVAMTQTWIDGIEADCAAQGILYKDLPLAAKPSISWQIFAFIILTAGEVLVSITCLEYAYTQAPPSMKSTIMASYLLTVTLGNVLVSVIQNNISSGGFFAQFHGAWFFWLFTGICAATALVFMLVSPRIKERSYVGVAE